MGHPLNQPPEWHPTALATMAGWERAENTEVLWAIRNLVHRNGGAHAKGALADFTISFDKTEYTSWNDTILITVTFPSDVTLVYPYDMYMMLQFGGVQERDAWIVGYDENTPTNTLYFISKTYDNPLGLMAIGQPAYPAVVWIGPWYFYSKITGVDPWLVTVAYPYDFSEDPVTQTSLPNQPLIINVDHTHKTLDITYQTDSNGDAVGSASQIVEALNADPSFSTYFTAVFNYEESWWAQQFGIYVAARDAYVSDIAVIISPTADPAYWKSPYQVNGSNEDTHIWYDDDDGDCSILDAQNVEYMTKLRTAAMIAGYPTIIAYQNFVGPYSDIIGITITETATIVASPRILSSMDSLEMQMEVGGSFTAS